jgi:sugar/nucleoside kinase (ribokinase family)
VLSAPQAAPRRRQSARGAPCRVTPSVTYRGAIAALTGADVPDAAMAGLDHLHTSSFYFQDGLRPDLPDLFARARRAGLTTSLDTGFDPSGRWDGGLRETLREADLFFPNEVELQSLTGCPDPAEGLRALAGGRTRVVAKLGAAGAMALDGGSIVHVPAYPVQAVDTTGAGDSFNAGFLHHWLQHQVDVDLSGAEDLLQPAAQPFRRWISKPDTTRVITLSTDGESGR